ncbi:hypothetical protein E4U42_004918, partial [Claviceps africana]
MAREWGDEGDRGVEEKGEAWRLKEVEEVEMATCKCRSCRQARTGQQQPAAGVWSASASSVIEQTRLDLARQRTGPMTTPEALERPSLNRKPQTALEDAGQQWNLLPSSTGVDAECQAAKT